ncbi:MAG: ribosomal L7Ae/L30e/S12e/Gadd45 family protein [Lachnospiraceae bacterium]|nr:ribosomal L7Ae/L30e/S12e/Gadd45 family protein [Lachnospiraceae bacterium]
MISLAAKAGKVSSGEFSVEKAIKEGRARLVIIACDASDNTKKHFSDMCTYRDIKHIVFGDSENLGRYCGKDIRKSLAICDEGLATGIEGKIDAANASCE